MRITVKYHDPTPAHVRAEFFINGRNCGTLTLGQEDVTGFEMILQAGCKGSVDQYLSKGKTLPSTEF